MTIQQDVTKTWHEAVIELFEIDLSSITDSAVDKYYFTANLMPDNSKISWKGQTYEPFPIEASGFERTTKGQIPTPELTVANVLGTLASVVNNFGDLVGAKVTRRRTLFKYLDNSSSPDSTQEFPDDEFYIERKIAESSTTITWQLSSKIDLEGLQLPRRIITQNYCLWKYRGAECGYNGPGVANENDQPIVIGGATSPQGQAYIDAYDAFDRARAKLATAEAKKNNLLSQKEALCDPDTADVVNTRFGFRADADGGYSFVIEDIGVAIWKNSAVSITGDKPLYRPDLKQKTGRSPGNGKNGTGPIYAVTEYSPNPNNGLGLPPIKTNLGGSGNTFAVKGLDGIFIIVVNGSVVFDTVDFGNEDFFGFEVGPKVSNGYAPIRSIAKLTYEKLSCGNITNQYDTAVEKYDEALVEYDAALAALNAAYAALPDSDEVRLRDKCGKRLQSCRLRFGVKGALPFGGFPAANLVR